MGRRKKKSGQMHFFGQDRGLSNSSIPTLLSLVAPQFHPIARHPGPRSRGYVSTCRRSWRGCPPVFSRHVVLRVGPVVRSGREWYEVHHRERERVSCLPPVRSTSPPLSLRIDVGGDPLRAGWWRQSREGPPFPLVSLSVSVLS